MSEIWRPIEGFYGYYEVSFCGKIRSVGRTINIGTSGQIKTCTRRVKERLLKPLKRKYHSVVLWKERQRTQIDIHVIVAKTFLGRRPEGFYACHKDGNPFNNRADNIYWGSPKQNCDDKIRHGKQAKGENHGQAKLSIDDVIAIRRMAGIIPQSQMSKKYGVGQAQISRIVNRQKWDGGYA